MIQRLKNRNPKLVTLLAVIFLILSFCLLPSQIFYWTLCTEQDRNIPPNTEVLVSSCKRPTVIGVPGGDVLFVHEGRTNKMYLLDLRTGEKRKVPMDPLLSRPERAIFLSRDLVWLQSDDRIAGHPGYHVDYIFDLVDGQRYELLDLTLLPRLEGNKFNPDNYSYIQSADHVFIELSENTLIALSTDFRTNQNGRVILSGYISDDDEFLLKLVKDIGIGYENVDLLLRSKFSNTPSPTGKYVARRDGLYIFDATAERKLGIPYPYIFKSWYYDDSGVVVHNDYGTYWILTQFFGDYYHLSYPVLKLRLPKP